MFKTNGARPQPLVQFRTDAKKPLTSPSAQNDHGHRNKRRRLSDGKPADPEARKLFEAKCKMGQERAKLPIYNYVLDFTGYLLQRPVLILSGETGSGKSTQVPQYIEDQDWCQAGVAVTQPRRVAAINLARRVAQEQFCSLGGKVGYSVRFDSKVSAETRIKYLTEGSLLQEMLQDPGLKRYDCVIVDEVHERSVDCDMLLGFLRRLITDAELMRTCRNGRPLKVVVMSATADVERLFEFFHTGFGVPVEKSVRKKPTEPAVKPAEAQINGADPDANMSRPAKKKQKKQSLAALAEDRLKALDSNANGTSAKPPQTANGHDKAEEDHTVYYSDHVTIMHVEGRQFPVREIFLNQDNDEFVDLAFEHIMRINKTEPMPGDILVFMTGQDTVTALMSYLRDKVGKLDKGLPDIYPLPLYAALPRAAQQAVFEPAPRGARKIIVATNIAETSLTIPGVRYVVDSGRVKEKEFRPALVLDALLVRPTSTASAIQRAGRAGREGPGKCWRLYTPEHAATMPEASTPEVLRTDLMRVALALKARGVADPLTFPLLDPPKPEAWRDALFRLTALRALDDEGQLLRAGKQMARLPLYPGYAAVIIAAAERDRLTASTTSDKKTSPLKPTGVSPSPSKSKPHAPPRFPPSTSLTLLAIDTIAASQSDEPFPLPLAHHPNSDDASAPPVSSSTGVTPADLAAQLERQRALHSRAGDHATAHATLTAYARIPRAQRREWAHDRHLSARALRAALDVRGQLRGAAAKAGLVSGWTVEEAEREEMLDHDGDVDADGNNDDDDAQGSDDDSADSDAPNAKWARKTNKPLRGTRASSPPPPPSEPLLAALAKCLLAGFWTNVAVRQAGTAATGGRAWYALALSGARVEVHPSSVVWGRKPAAGAIVFGELVRTTRAYARTVSCVEVEWIGEVVGGAGAGKRGV